MVRRPRTQTTMTTRTKKTKRMRVRREEPAVIREPDE
jgi:hypothetical protein